MSDAIFGIVLGFFIGIFVIDAFHGTLEQARELKAQCEQDLPRSEECVMTYVRGKE